MDDREARKLILTKLKEVFDDDSHTLYSSEALMSTLKIPKNELDRNIKYLHEKGLIDVQWFLGGNFIARINSYGIDVLESDSLLEPVETKSMMADSLVEEFDGIQAMHGKISKFNEDVARKLEILNNQIVEAKTSLQCSQIAFGCRDILMDFTDLIFKKEYTPEGKKEPTREQIKNKIIFTLNSKEVYSETNKQLISALIDYFSAFVSYIQKNVHPPKGFTVQKTDAYRCIIYTYMIIDHVLELMNFG